MSFTNKQVYDLNNMNVAAQNVQLGTLLSSMESGKLDLSGGTMTGALTLAGAPVNDLEAATKKYVDDNAGGGGLFELIVLESFNPDDTEQVTTLGEAVVAVIEDDKIPIITVYGYYLNLTAILSGGVGREYQFMSWTINLNTPTEGVLNGILLTYDSVNNEWSAVMSTITITGQE